MTKSAALGPCPCIQTCTPSCSGFERRRELLVVPSCFLTPGRSGDPAKRLGGIWRHGGLRKRFGGASSRSPMGASGTRSGGSGPPSESTFRRTTWRPLVGGWIRERFSSATSSATWTHSVRWSSSSGPSLQHQAGFKSASESVATSRSNSLTDSHTNSHTPQIGKARHDLSHCRASLPLLGSNQDSPDPESGVLPVTPRGRQS